MNPKLESHKRDIARTLRRFVAAHQRIDTDQQFPSQPTLYGQITAKLLSDITVGSKTAKDVHQEDIGVLNQRQHDLEQRVSILERKLNMPTSVDIEELIKTTFSNTTIIEKIYVKPRQSSLLLIIVYNSKTVSDAIAQIQPGLAKLEDAFPDLYFDPCILHVNEIHEGHLQQSKLIIGS